MNAARPPSPPLLIVDSPCLPPLVSPLVLYLSINQTASNHHSPQNPSHLHHNHEHHPDRVEAPRRRRRHRIHRHCPRHQIVHYTTTPLPSPHPPSPRSLASPISPAPFHSSHPSVIFFFPPRFVAPLFTAVNNFSTLPTLPPTQAPHPTNQPTNSSLPQTNSPVPQVWRCRASRSAHPAHAGGGQDEHRGAGGLHFAPP